MFENKAVTRTRYRAFPSSIYYHTVYEESGNCQKASQAVENHSSRRGRSTRHSGERDPEARAKGKASLASRARHLPRGRAWTEVRSRAAPRQRRWPLSHDQDKSGRDLGLVVRQALLE